MKMKGILAWISMMKRRFSKHLARALALMMLGGVLVIVAPANRVTTAPLPSTLPAASPTPVATPETSEKKPNPVPRFFSSIGHGITGVFRRPDRFYCILPPTVLLTSSSPSITVCPVSKHPINASCSSSSEVTLAADAGGAENNVLRFAWAVTAGRLRGEGSKVIWDLTGVQEGTYTATVEVDDVNQHTASATTSVAVAPCSECVFGESPCAVVWVSCPANVESQSLTFVASLAGGDTTMKPTYQWSLSAGKIISGQGTSKVVVDVSNHAGKSLTATVKVGGFDPLCTEITVASCSTQVGQH